MDLFEKCRQFTIAREAIAAGYYPYFTVLDDNSEGTEVVIGGRKVIMIGSNNYLGLTTDMRVRQAAIDATQKYGTSCTGCRFLNGTLELHLEAERRLAEFVGKEAALVFSTGFQTNLGTISALVGKGDVVIIDKEDHASIVDGCRLAAGRDEALHSQRHGLAGERVASVPGQCGQARRRGRRIFNGRRHCAAAGDRGAVQEIRRAADGGRCALDRRAGRPGRGTANHFGLTDQVDLIMGTFSKSFASLGGFIAGDDDVMHYVQHHARSFMFSASMPAANVAAVLAALDIMENEPERIERCGTTRKRCAPGSRRWASTSAPARRPSSRS